MLLIPFFSLLLFGCNPSQYLTKEESEQIYSHELQLKKDEIKSRILQFANEKFVSGKSVLQTTEDGLISGNAVTDVIQNGLGLSRVQMEFTFIVKYTDNSYKVKWIIKNLSGNKGVLASEYWGYYSQSIAKTIQDNDKSLFDYLSRQELDF